jgi:hypothetical protein
VEAVLQDLQEAASRKEARTMKTATKVALVGGALVVVVAALSIAAVGVILRYDFTPYDPQEY